MVIRSADAASLQLAESRPHLASVAMWPKIYNFWSVMLIVIMV